MWERIPAFLTGVIVRILLLFLALLSRLYERGKTMEKMKFIPPEAQAWVDDCGFVYVGPLPGGMPLKPYVRFDGVDSYGQVQWTWTGIHYGVLSPYPTEKVDELITWSIESEKERSNG